MFKVLYTIGNFDTPLSGALRGNYWVSGVFYALLYLDKEIFIASKIKSEAFFRSQI